MVIEFAGLPGSGKSTLVPRIAAATNLPYRILNPIGMSTLLRHPAPARRLPTYVAAAWRAGDRRRSVVHLARRAMHQELLVARGTPVLLEEGLVHHVWRTVFDTPQLARRAWVPLLRRTHPLVVFEVDAATQHDRIRSKRSPGRINQVLATDGPDGPAWIRAIGSFRDVVEVAALQAPMRVVDTSGTEDDALERALAAIEDLVPAIGGSARRPDAGGDGSPPR